MTQEPQCTSTVLMIKPAHFGFNLETADSNAFQKTDTAISKDQMQTLARQEFEQLVALLRENHISVLEIDDLPESHLPDAVFPNNWITTHSDGTLITYPMYSPLRRAERREDILEWLEKNYVVKNRYSFEYFEAENKFLEGTGSMILDRKNKMVYACLSPRTDPELLERFALLKRYDKTVFKATDPEGKSIYHTNVIMAIGADTAIICLDCIPDEQERKLVEESILKSGKKIIELSWNQVVNFAGNMLQLINDRGQYIWVMSSSAYDSLTESQRLTLQSSAVIVHSPIPTIEKFGGGSVRCMLAEIFLAGSPR